MNEAELKAISDSVGGIVEKTVSGIVDTKIAEISAKQASEIELIKAELKKFNISQNSGTPEQKKLFKETAIVSILKQVVLEGVTSESKFQSIIDTTVKTMTEGTAGDGAEMVFDNFETDILRAMSEYNLINSVRIIPVAKGDTVKIPKATNGITTTFVDEGTTYGSSSEPDTAFVTIDIKKAVTLTDFTQELLEDTMTIPDLYNLIVECISESQAQFVESKILTATTGAIIGVIPGTASGNKFTLGAGETGKDIIDSDLVKLIMAVPKKFMRGDRSAIKFVMSQYTMGLLMSIKTLDGYPLYPELRDFENPKLLGYNVEISDAMPVQNVIQDIADANQIVFGNFKHYIVARRKGITFERGYYGDNWKKDIQTLKSNQRLGGKQAFDTAFAVLSNGA